MEPVTSATRAVKSRRLRMCAAGHWRRLAAGLILTMAAGCVGTGPFVKSEDTPPPGAPACQVVTTWCNQVVFTPDPTHNGDTTPGLAGRVYLFGQTIDFPVVGDGCLVVDLFDEDRPAAQGKAASPLEEWRLDRDTLRRLLRRDPVGWGYTVFLPWATYRPDVIHLQLKIRYEPANGTPLFAGTPLTLKRNTELATEDVLTGPALGNRLQAPTAGNAQQTLQRASLRQ